VRDELLEPRLERAIGVVYRPETERQSHYLRATLPRQFDEFVWFDETTAVSTIQAVPSNGRAVWDTYPF
jgi:protein-L-isoaspartate(D-aspartate) O-methyltransferase